MKPPLSKTQAVLAAIAVAACLLGLILGTITRQQTVEEKELSFEKAGLCQGISKSVALENIDQNTEVIEAAVIQYAGQLNNPGYCSYLGMASRPACLAAAGAQ
jgi:hypothetical protein